MKHLRTFVCMKLLRNARSYFLYTGVPNPCPLFHRALCLIRCRLSPTSHTLRAPATNFRYSDAKTIIGFDSVACFPKMAHQLNFVWKCLRATLLKLMLSIVSGLPRVIGFFLKGLFIFNRTEFSFYLMTLVVSKCSLFDLWCRGVSVHS